VLLLLLLPLLLLLLVLLASGANRNACHTSWHPPPSASPTSQFSVRSDTTQGLPSPLRTRRRSASKAERSSGEEEKGGEEEEELVFSPLFFLLLLSPSASSSPNCTVIPAKPDLALPAAPGPARLPRNSAVAGKREELESNASVLPPCAASLKTLHLPRSSRVEKEARRWCEGGWGSRTEKGDFFF